MYFEQCRRRHYWKSTEVGMDGINPLISDKQKAYLLSKMQNRWSLIGVVAEQSIMWMLKQHQSKNFVIIMMYGMKFLNHY